MSFLIKETIDAVRLAELEAEKVISTAQDNAQDRRNQIKAQGEAYRSKAFDTAAEDAKQAMELTVDKCKQYEEEYNKKVEDIIAKLNSEAEAKMDAAVTAVIEALV